MQKKAVILLSGGLDSTTCLAIAKSQNFACYALSFDYGQKNKSELITAKYVAEKMDVIEHKIFNLPIGELHGSALTDSKIAVQDYKGDGKIPSTYVPARNTIFLSIALAWAEIVGAHDIFFGANAVDYSGYPDCRPEYKDAFQRLANLSAKESIESATEIFKIHAPLILLTKKEIITTGIKLGVDYSMTVSCYRADAQGHACGKCDSCTFRKKGFTEAGIADPTRYAYA